MDLNKYFKLNEKYLKNGEKFLAEGELAQACEKFWGAVAEAIKAIAESRGWEHVKHRHLMETISRLFRETRDEELLRLMASAERLHSNFYENFMSKEEVEVHITDAKKLIEKLKALMRKMDK